MRNALLFLLFVLLSLAGAVWMPTTPLTGAGYGLETPPQTTTRFTDTTRCYLEPLQDVSEFLAAR